MAVENSLVNSIVGPGTYVKGQFNVQGLLRIDGDFAGSVKTSGRVIIGRSGRADCTIDAATVVIGGVFRGTLYASDKVIALESALILGNVYAPRCIVESGVLIDGAVHIRGSKHAAVDADTADAAETASSRPPHAGPRARVRQAVGRSRALRR